MVETILRVDGMMCGMCESHINDVVRKTARVLPTPRAKRSSSRSSRWMWRR